MHAEQYPGENTGENKNENKDENKDEKMIHADPDLVAFFKRHLTAK